ncbi:hypothetical protein COCCADRAFT_109554 [Bipolaris zeicola 26-R-13]|uniref:Uncharacterized protein n=1 Tax=Cochliobolus carbonum (strain 26-R-13) TaxID=930089 RepID=W6XSL8_COCC2|nr:uncharacterized protein COCCADRAFT_109554 [Bipolaris zeicola 26-R-13]EUC28290.1 hypothetical protein COCCADRAFT_109554 [Bipolaris zeicola 26-R-13]
MKSPEEFGFFLHGEKCEYELIPIIATINWSRSCVGDTRSPLCIWMVNGHVANPRNHQQITCNSEPRPAYMDQKTSIPQIHFTPYIPRYPRLRYLSGLSTILPACSTTASAPESWFNRNFCSGR